MSYNTCVDESRVNFEGKNKPVAMCVHYDVKTLMVLASHECIIDRKLAQQNCY